MNPRAPPLDWALFYLSRGLSPVPARKDIKAPLIQDWTKYAEVKPSKEDIEEWFEGKTWNDVNIFLVMGNGIFGIDFDKPELWYLFFSKTPEELARDTWVEKTPKGYHVYFRASEEVKTIEAPGLVELKGDGRGFLVAPSIRSDGGRYEFISNIEEVKISRLDDFQILEAGELIKKIKKLYPVIREVLPIWKEGMRHDVAVLLSGAMHSKSITLKDGEFIIRAICKLARDEELEDRIRALYDTYADATPSGIPKFKEKIGKEFGEDVAERILQKLTELSPYKSQIEKNTEDKKERVEKKPYVYTDDKLYLAVWDGNDKYAFAELENGEIVFSPKIEVNGKIYEPKEIESNENGTRLPIEYPTFGVTSAPVLTTDELFRELERHIYKYVDLSNDDIELSIFYILSTWFYVKNNTVAYLRFIGDTGKGKSRMLKVIGDLCFYPLSLGGNSTRSAIMRVQEEYHGTLILDESDFRGDKENEMTKYINTGFERGKPIILTNKNTGKREIFDPFSPKLFAMRHPFRDSATEGRVLSIEPYETQRDDIPAVLPLKYEEEVKQLRDILARWTLENWSKVKPQSREIIQTLDIEPRLKQLATPLATILPLFDGEMDNKFIQWLKKRQGEIARQRASTDEGYLFNTIVDMATGTITGEDLPKYVDYLDDFEDGRRFKVITTGMLKEYTGLNSRKINKLLEELGFTVEKRKIEVNGKNKTPHVAYLQDTRRWMENWRRYRWGENIIEVPEILKHPRREYESVENRVKTFSVPTVPEVPDIYGQISTMPQHYTKEAYLLRSDNIGAQVAVCNSAGTAGTTGTNPYPSKDKIWRINPDGKGEDLLLVDDTPPEIMEAFSSKLLKLENGNVVILPLKTAIMYEGMELAEPLTPTLLDYFTQPWSKLIYQIWNEQAYAVLAGGVEYGN